MKRPLVLLCVTLTAVAILGVLNEQREDAVSLVNPGPGLTKVNAMFDAEQAQEDSQIEANLQSSLAADQKRLRSFATSNGLSPREAQIRDRLHQSIAESGNALSRVIRSETSASTGRLARQAARLAALNAQAASQLQAVNQQEKKENELEYQQNVVAIKDRISRNAALVDQVSKESQRDDSGYVAQLKGAISKHSDQIASIEQDEFDRKHRAMRQHLESGLQRRRELADAVQQSDGPAGFSAHESNIAKELKKSLERDAANIASARSNEEDDTKKIEAALLARNRKSLECLSSKAYLRGGC